MTSQNLVTALPFFVSRDAQTYRQPYMNGYVEAGAIPMRYIRILPFTIKVGSGDSVNFVYLVNRAGTRAMKIDGLFTIESLTDGSDKYVFCSAGTDVNPLTSVPHYSSDPEDNPYIWDSIGTTIWASFVVPGDMYYIEASIGSTRYHSELVQIFDIEEFGPDLCNPFVRLEAISACPVGDAGSTVNAEKLFVMRGAVNDPEYQITRKVQTDGLGNEKPIFQRLRKVHRLQVDCIESVADWLNTIALYIGASEPAYQLNITDESGYQRQVAIESVQTSWPAEYNGALARVDLFFYDYEIVQTGCC
jgi:hypothetical protein